MGINVSFFASRFRYLHSIELQFAVQLLHTYSVMYNIICFTHYSALKGEYFKSNTVKYFKSKKKISGVCFLEYIPA